ncbi:MAG TPA: hypothetical protein VNO50_05865 [Pyrinomonadaceae bacterium]|nr:hypothetical protein [Pyrinomonadaceae bacterium]
MKEREDPKKETVSAYLTTIFLLGLGGLGLMLGGAIALKNGAQFPEQLIGIFLLMAFLIIGIVEIFLCRQLSRIIGGKEQWESKGLQPAMPAELGGPKPRGLSDHVPSVTDNTTRTLEYSRNESVR